ncbi:MAG: ABC transporter substrate-binding protein, partial [Solirubrobacteraceae bacterium]
MTDHEFSNEKKRDRLTRRQVLHGALAGGAMLSAGGLLAACGGSSSSSGSGGGGTAKSSPPSTGTIKPGGSLKVGATGGGAKDTIDAHLPTADPDIMRCWNLYEPLAVRPPSFGPLEMMVAESIEAEHGKADSWVVKIRPGIEFHNGKSVTADDVIFSLNRILDPKDPKVGAASIGYIDAKGLKKISSSQVRIPLKFANAAFLDDLGQYFNAIVPTNYDPKNPVGTGAFMYASFTPGQQSVFKKFPNYWQSGRPYVDQLTI